MTLHAALRCHRSPTRRLPKGARHALRHGRRAFAFTALASMAQAELVGFEVLNVESPALEGRTFGDVGMVEKITGRATIALDPADPRNAVIADIDLAPKNAAGLVLAVADVEILRPLEGGNGTILLEVPNRGRKLMSILFDETADATAASRLEQASDAGNGFLLSQGYTLVWVGWQGDLLGRAAALRIDVPLIDGITGPSREEFVFDDLDDPVTVPLTYPAAAVPGACRADGARRPEDKREQPADLSFRFLAPQQVEISRPDGFDAGAIYELIYMAKDPLVLGMGFAGVRDVAAFLRTTRPRPIRSASRLPHAYAHRRLAERPLPSRLPLLGLQRGRAGPHRLRRDEPARPGPARTYTNSRFAQTGRNPSSQTDRLYQADQFPFTYAVTLDPVSGRRDGLMARCRLSSTCPKVIETDSEAELFGSRGSLLVTDTQGNHVDLPPDVRAYLIAGHPHFAAPGSVASMTEACALSRNPLHAGAPMRALLVATGRVGKQGVEPPASRYPMLAHGTLVPADGLYPEIPGLLYAGVHTPANLIDYANMPPQPVASYPVCLPRVDADGLAVDGIRLPVIEVPLATYTGWNPRAEGYGAGALCTNQGAVIPFAEDACGASGGWRSAAVDRGALSERERLCRRGASGERALGRRAPVAARRRRSDGRGRQGRRACAVSPRPSRRMDPVCRGRRLSSRPVRRHQFLPDMPRNL